VAIVTSVDQDGNIDAAPMSYIMVISYDPAMVALVVSKGRSTHRNIHGSGEFVMNFVSIKILKELWFLGRPNESFPKKNKFELSGLTPIESEEVKPPRIKESIAHIECKVKHELMFQEGKNGMCTLFIARVLACSADDGVLSNPNSQYDLKKARVLHHYGCNVFGTDEEPIYAGVQREITLEETFKYISTKQKRKSEDLSPI
jgi:flavin reductase (DIM6/NTAB) family NADH-FMN oxidoreductase RutF